MQIKYNTMYQHKYSGKQVETICSQDVESNDSFIKVTSGFTPCIEFMCLKKGTWSILTIEDFLKNYEEVKK